MPASFEAPSEVNVIPLSVTVMDMPLMVTSESTWRAYGWSALQPGSSMNAARLPGVSHLTNSMVWSLGLLTASPGKSEMGSIVCVMSCTAGLMVVSSDDTAPVSQPSGEAFPQAPMRSACRRYASNRV